MNEANQRANYSACYGEAKKLEQEGKLNEAEKRFSQALAIADDLKDPAIIGESSYALGRLSVKLKKYDQAEPLFRKTVEYRSQLSTKNNCPDPYIGLAYNELAFLNMERSNIKRAVWYMSKALDNMRVQPNQQPQFILQKMKSLLVMFEAAEMRVDAEELREQIFALEKSLQAKPNNSSNNAVSKELQMLADADQACRQQNWANLSAEQRKAIYEDDFTRRTRVKEILATVVLKEGRDFFNAALILQHSDSDHLLSHNLAVLSGDRWLTAATLDRYLMNMKQQTVFATQIVKNGNSPWQVADCDHSAIYANLRRSYGVASLDEQEKRADQMNA